MMGQTDRQTDRQTDARPLHRPCCAGDAGDLTLESFFPAPGELLLLRRVKTYLLNNIVHREYGVVYISFSVV